MSISTTLNKEYLPAYATSAGKRAYDDTLASVKTDFPQYVRELEGIAEGANVPFYKVMDTYKFCIFHRTTYFIELGETGAQ